MKWVYKSIEHINKLDFWFETHFLEALHWAKLSSHLSLSLDVLERNNGSTLSRFKHFLLISQPFRYALLKACFLTAIQSIMQFFLRKPNVSLLLAHWNADLSSSHDPINLGSHSYTATIIISFGYTRSQACRHCHYDRWCCIPFRFTTAVWAQYATADSKDSRWAAIQLQLAPFQWRFFWNGNAG